MSTPLAAAGETACLPILRANGPPGFPLMGNFPKFLPPSPALHYSPSAIHTSPQTPPTARTTDRPSPAHGRGEGGEALHHSLHARRPKTPPACCTTAPRRGPRPDHRCSRTASHKHAFRRQQGPLSRPLSAPHPQLPGSRRAAAAAATSPRRAVSATNRWSPPRHCS